MASLNRTVRRRRLLSLALPAALAFCGVFADHAAAVKGDCVQPVSTGAAPTATDCLYVLRAAVGIVTCDPACICSPRGHLPPTAADALVCLKSVVGQSVALACPCPPVVARIEIEPGALLLTSAAESAALTARAFDKDDQPMDVDFTWESSNPEAVSVETDGTVTAQVSPASAQIVAKAEGASSPPVLVVVATPAPGALMVADEDILELPQPEEEDSEYGLGSRYRIVLDEMEAPDAGTILLASESAPVGGRVVEVETRQDGTLLVLLEVVPIEAMFAELRVDEEIDLSRAGVEFPDEILADYETARDTSGKIFFEPKTKAGTQLSQPVTGRIGAALEGAQGTSALGPFACQFTTTFPLVSLISPSFTVTPDLDFVFAYDSNAGGFEQLALKGSVKAELKNETQLTAAFEGKIECSAELVALTIPIGGPLALVIGGHVPLGAGFELGGKVTVASVGFEAAVEAGAQFNLGLACPGTQSCEFVNTLDADADGKIQARNLPDYTDDLSDFLDNARVEPGFLAFGFARLALGNRFIPSLRFEALDVKAGLSATANLASIPTQLLDGSYASDAKLSLEAVAGAGKSFDALLGLLQVSVIKLESKISVPLSRSPAALQAHADAAEFGVGDTVRFTVVLDAATTDFLPIGYNVESVRIYRMVDMPDLGRRPVLIATRPASPDQVEFQLDWIASEEGDLGADFFAMVTTHLPAPVPLELAPVSAPLPTTTITTTTTSTTTTTTLPTGNVVPSYRFSRVFALAFADAKPEFRNPTVDATERSDYVYVPMAATAEQSDAGTIGAEMVTATASAASSASADVTSNATDGILRVRDSGTADVDSTLSHSFASTGAGSDARAVFILDFTVKQATPFRFTAAIEQSVKIGGTTCLKRVRLTRFSPFSELVHLTSADLADPTGIGTADVEISGTLSKSTYRLDAEVTCAPSRSGTGTLAASAAYELDLMLGPAAAP